MRECGLLVQQVASLVGCTLHKWSHAGGHDHSLGTTQHNLNREWGARSPLPRGWIPWGASIYSLSEGTDRSHLHVLQATCGWGNCIPHQRQSHSACWSRSAHRMHRVFWLQWMCAYWPQRKKASLLQGNTVQTMKEFFLHHLRFWWCALVRFTLVFSIQRFNIDTS